MEFIRWNNIYRNAPTSLHIQCLHADGIWPEKLYICISTLHTADLPWQSFFFLWEKYTTLQRLLWKTHQTKVNGSDVVNFIYNKWHARIPERKRSQTFSIITSVAWRPNDVHDVVHPISKQRWLYNLSRFASSSVLFLDTPTGFVVLVVLNGVEINRIAEWCVNIDGKVKSSKDQVLPVGVSIWCIHATNSTRVWDWFKRKKNSVAEVFFYYLRWY